MTDSQPDSAEMPRDVWLTYSRTVDGIGERWLCGTEAGNALPRPERSGDNLGELLKLRGSYTRTDLVEELIESIEAVRDMGELPDLTVILDAYRKATGGAGE